MSVRANADEDRFRRDISRSIAAFRRRIRGNLQKISVGEATFGNSFDIHVGYNDPGHALTTDLRVTAFGRVGIRRLERVCAARSHSRFLAALGEGR
jgi:hypothetical protein